MQSVLNEIVQLRNGKTTEIDYHNSNRYRVVVSEKNGTKTAYCFSVPIYNKNTNKLLNLRFLKSEIGRTLNGSDSEITIGQSIVLKNKNGICKINLSGNYVSGTEKSIRYGNSEIFPTLNGICICAPCIANERYCMNLRFSRSFMNIRANDRVFSLMYEEFKPFVTVSCIGVKDGEGRFIAPCKLDYQKINDIEYCVCVRHDDIYGKALMFEINLYEEKLFSDTTVESGNPDMNNAYGTTAFIGTTSSYGEQWLYSRPDFSRLSEIYDKQILRAVLHIPRYGGNCRLTAFGLASRFCSFGSKWENKISAAEELADVYSEKRYQSLDIKNLITDKTDYLKPFEGFILKPKGKSNDFSVLSTGDSFFAPQILEVNFL